MKKVAHVISSLKVGGAERLLLWLIQELPEYEHHVIYLHDGPVREQLEQLSAQNSRHFIFLYKLHGLIKPYDPLACVRLIKLLKTVKPDCVISSLWAASILTQIAASLLKLPVLAIAHAHKNHEGSFRNILTTLVTIFTKNPKAFIAISPSVARSWKKFCKKQSLTLVTIPNGIQTSRREHLTQHHLALKQNPHNFIIGAVGRLVPVKRFDFLIKSFSLLIKEYSHAKLILVGGGPLEHELRSLAYDSLGLQEKVIFMGEKNAWDYYPFFNCFVQTSEYEQLSLVLLEALYHELPVIATIPDKSSHHDVLTHLKTGIVCPAQDSKALRDALLWVINNPSAAHRLGVEGKQLVDEKYTSIRMAQAYKKLIESNL